MQNLSRVGRAAPAGQNRIVPSAKTLLPRALRILKANEVGHTGVCIWTPLTSTDSSRLLD